MTRGSDKLSLDARSKQFGAAEADGIIRCDACPVLCRIRPGRPGACSRYANDNGRLVRTDPVVLMQRAIEGGGKTVAFSGQNWDDGALDPARTFVTGVGSGTTYPDYKPAPFIVEATHDGVDTVTVVTEGIFSYCGVKVKIDTDRHLGPEAATVRANGEAVGHVTTAEYGSQMLSLGGVRHLTGGSKKEGNVTCDMLQALCSGEAVEFAIDGGHRVIVQAGQAPIVDGKPEVRMRVGCGSATVGIFAQQWVGHVDEVIVVDDHITGVLSEHQAGRVLDMRPAGIRVRGRKSTPGRYFKVAEPGLGWGGTDISDPLSIVQGIDPKVAWPGLRLLFTSTTGEDALYCVLDQDLKPVAAEMPEAVARVVGRIGENCEPSLCSVLFMAGAGGSLRAGVTQNPVLLTRSVQKGETRVTMGGAPVHVFAGGGITVMVDVTRLPKGSFGTVPTPAIVAPIEFTLPKALYLTLGGHSGDIVRIEDVIMAVAGTARVETWQASNPWPFQRPFPEEVEMTTVAKATKRPPMKKSAVKAPTKAGAPAKPATEKSKILKAVAAKPAPPKVVKIEPQPTREGARKEYVLDDQIGFRLRRAHQRASVIFNDVMARFDVTPTQFAALAKLDDLGIVSQNQLGRATAMDPATILGVVGRLVRQGLMRTRPDPIDGRQMLLELTPEGKAQMVTMKAAAATVSKRTLAMLSPDDAETLIRLLAKIG